jgi:hypothetical protein
MFNDIDSYVVLCKLAVILEKHFISFIPLCGRIVKFDCLSNEIEDRNLIFNDINSICTILISCDARGVFYLLCSTMWKNSRI